MIFSLHRKGLAAFLVSLLVLFFLGGFFHAVVPHDHQAMSAGMDLSVMIHAFGERGSWVFAFVLALFVRSLLEKQVKKIPDLFTIRWVDVWRPYTKAYSQGILNTKRYE